MAVTPGEHDRLLLFTQAELARARRARGLRHGRLHGRLHDLLHWLG